MKRFLIPAVMFAALAGCLAPEEPEDTGPKPVPLSVPLATG